MSALGSASKGVIAQLKGLWDNVRVDADSDIETYCKKNFTLRSDIAYENKRKIQSLNYSVFLNEIITPKAFSVQNFMNKVILPEDRLAAAKILGDKVAKTLTWTDDKNLDKSGDYYLYPSESLTLKKCDCEDHAFLVTSCSSEFAVAYGFQNSVGHAFNVFVYGGELLVLDTVQDKAIIAAAEGAGYEIRYIITPNYTFIVKGGIQFGEIAGWDK